jgi:hypothetical protein
MGKGRLEAFTDAVVAIIITIMVLEMKAPPGGDLARTQDQLPMFLAYVISYITIGIFWNNHHHTRCMRPSASTGGCCGPTSICCSGCRATVFWSAPSLPATAAPQGSPSRSAMTSRAGCRSACIPCRSRSPS